MKAIAINGSPHSEGNTYHALRVMGNVLEQEGIEFEILHLGHKAIHGCIACNKCAKTHNEQCAITSDAVNETLQRLKTADAILLGSPVYYSGVAGTMKSLLDRLFYVAGVNGGLFRHKIGASVATLRRTGGSSTVDCLNHYFSISQMPVASSTYWNVIHGAAPGEVLQDEEGVQTLQNLAANVAWLLKMREQTKDTVPTPGGRREVSTNFIR